MTARARRLERLGPWILSLLILFVWEAVCRVFAVSDFIFPAPTAVGSQRSSTVTAGSALAAGAAIFTVCGIPIDAPERTHRY